MDDVLIRASMTGAALLMLVVMRDSSVSQAGGPLIITHGGTYSGEWESRDSATPAVLVNTIEPVVIENSVIRSRGVIIQAGAHADLTVRNVLGVGMVPDRADQYVGRFIDARLFHRLIVEECTLEHTSGIYLHGYGGDHSAGQTFKILRNKASNIDGRFGDGRGGYADKVYLVQFVQLNDVKDLARGEIGWNEVINQPGESAVEDNINVFASSGTAASPLEIHDNYIQGAYPADPKSATYSGGGIMLSDHGSSFVIARDNTVVATSNYGIAISSGHDNCFYRNRIVSSGTMPDGSPVPSQNVGAYIWNMEKQEGFTRNSGHDNAIGWLKGDARADWWTPDAAAEEWKDNAALEAVTRETEAAEYRGWEEKLRAGKVRVGATTRPIGKP